MTTSALDQDLWIRRYHPSAPDAPRLICFPHAGGSATSFFRLSALLTPGIEVLAVQYPGRQDRRGETCAETIGELATAFIAASAAWRSERYTFLGHSMGAIVAYEVARRLDERALPGPVRLIASGRRAPSRFRPGDVHLRDDEGLLDELRELGGTDERLLADPEIRQLTIGPTRSDYKAVETYQDTPGFRLSCPVTVLAGTEDPHTTLDEAAAWADHTNAGCEVLTFPGGHFFLDERRVEVAAAIRRVLDGPAGA
jgi:surfactin synthase thioesterase subunit